MSVHDMPNEPSHESFSINVKEIIAEVELHEMSVLGDSSMQNQQNDNQATNNSADSSFNEMEIITEVELHEISVFGDSSTHKQNENQATNNSAASSSNVLNWSENKIDAHSMACQSSSLVRQLEQTSRALLPKTDDIISGNIPFYENVSTSKIYLDPQKI